MGGLTYFFFAEMNGPQKIFLTFLKDWFFLALCLSTLSTSGGGSI